MTAARLALSSLPVLALAACAPSDKDEREGAAPFGYELALAQGETPAPAETAAIVDLTPDQLREKLEAGGIRLIDVRTDEEVAEGMIPGAEHVALDQFDPAELGLDDGREVVLYCRSGRRSGMAAEKLAEFTGKPAEHLEGGILAWQESGGPVE